MRYLITGGAGFVGSHLAEALLARGDEVYIIDDLSTGNRSNIRHLEEDPQYKNRIFFKEDTILNENAMLELVGTCDVVLHMAAAVGVQYIIDNPLSSIVTNVRGTEIVLELCAKFRKKVLLASTSEVYGKQEHAPLVETDSCHYGSSQKSRWSYAAGKLMDEFTGLAYYRTLGLPVYIVRMFNTVGPRQTGRYGMVIPRFVQQAVKNKPITVYGEGSQTRTFTHVREVVAAILALAECPEAQGQVVNVGGVEEISILNLARRIRDLVGSESEIKLVPYEEAYPEDFEDMQRRVPSTEKLKSLIGFAPQLKLDAILENIINYYKQQDAAQNPFDVPRPNTKFKGQESPSYLG